MATILNTSELAISLFDAAADRAKANDLAFGSGAEQWIREKCQEAALSINMSAESDPQSALTAAQTAESAFQKLVDAMASARLRIEGYADAHPDEIGEETLSSALKELCPLWPIC